MTETREHSGESESQRGAAPAEHESEQFEEGVETPPPGVRTMAVVRWLLVLAMAAAALASILYGLRERGHAERDAGAAKYYCPMHPGVVQDDPGECPICGMTLVLRQPAGPAQQQTAAASAAAPAEHQGHRHESTDPYYCPMHPEETGVDAAARCALCGMKLVPKPAPAPRASGGAQEPQAAPEPEAVPVAGLVPLDLSHERVQLIGMRTARVSRSSLPAELRAVGYVTPTESGLAVVQTRYTGWIQELHVRQTGQPVSRGELLARIYSPELLSAQQELLNAKRWTGSGSSGGGAGLNLADNARRRLLLLGMQPEELAQIERSGELHQLVEIRSPARGYVAQRTAVEGLYIQPGTRLFEIADLTKVWVIADVPERDAGRIRSGQAATFELTAYPGEPVRGRVDFLYPTLNAETRTLRARIELKNPELRLRPGMFGDVTITLSASQGLSIPSEAVVDTGEHQYVFLAESDAHFTPRAVRLGARAADRVQVLAGLKEGDTVVTTGNFLIDSESRLRATLEGTPSAPQRATACEALFDRARYPDKFARCRACEAQHPGVGSLEEDCREAIAKPWR